MQQQIDRLIARIIENYESRNTDCPANIKENMDRKFRESIEVIQGKKYIKIMKSNSVWGFIVAVDNDKKFKCGDILMAQTIKGPTRNHARGNIFDDDYYVDWTGPRYMS